MKSASYSMSGLDLSRIYDGLDGTVSISIIAFDDDDNEFIIYYSLNYDLQHYQKF